MGTSLGCCTNLSDETNFKEFCMANSSPEYLHFLTEVINAPQPITSDQIRGDWHQNSTKTGKGIIYSPGKFYYEGDIVDSKASGHGKIIWDSRMIYHGIVADNRANGHGVLRFQEDETALRGQWVNGQPQINNKMQLTSKSHFFSITILQFNRSLDLQGAHGEILSIKARIEFEGGHLYEGQVKRKKDSQYKIEGNGRMTFADGSEYVGEFQNGKMHGKGKYRWAKTGHWYEGDYKSNFRDGNGTYFYDQHKFRSGIWRGGHLQPEQVS